MAAKDTDYLAMATRMKRADFVAACEFPFLIARGSLNKPEGPRRTVSYFAEDVTSLLKSLPGEDKAEPAPLIMAVRKVQENFPSMITVGRTANNDVVVSDVSVSKFHAFFKKNGARLELSDAGSTNGTFVNDVELLKNGPPTAAAPGDAVRFGRVDFELIDAGVCWDHLRGLSG